MEIQFYLNDEPVQQGFFKKFSSGCDTWTQFIKQNEPALSYIEGTLRLVYTPCDNAVRANYDKDVRLVRWIDEEISNRQSEYDSTHGQVLERI